LPMPVVAPVTMNVWFARSGAMAGNIGADAARVKSARPFARCMH